MPPHVADRSEQTPLLNDHRSGDEEQGGDIDARETLSFKHDDVDNPRNWPRRKKMANVFVIALMSILSPLASSAFTPGIEQIADDLNTDVNTVIGTTTGFIVSLGIGPLLLAPLSETYGRRRLYLICFGTFTLLQIPTALSPNIQTLIAVRTIAGFFGSVGIANGGGTISDMFVPAERAGIFGWYLLGPLMGPTLGPVFGGVTVQRLGWRWIFYIMLIVCSVNTLAAYFFLKESYAPILLQRRKQRLEKEENSPNKYKAEGHDERPLLQKLKISLSRPFRIFVQPIVIIMSIYQGKWQSEPLAYHADMDIALIFATTFSMYTQFQQIFGDGYSFDTEHVGLLYMGPGVGFLFAVWFLVPRIDTIYKNLSEKNNGKARPEFRLPIANIGAVFIPISLFWFAWTIEYHTHWAVALTATFFYGIGQVCIINVVQNYVLDSFEQFAASAIAAVTVFRSIVGGVVPLITPSIVKAVGYGWAFSIFGFLAVIIAPAPILFYRYGQAIRERYAIQL